MRKKIVQILSGLFPTAFTKLAYQQLTRPQVQKLRANELVTLQKAQSSDFDFKGFKIKTYTWPGGAEKVLLIHGWEGQAGNFSDLVEKLMKKNYTIHAFDGPSHGFSSKGRTSLFEFTELVGAMIKKFDVHQLVSHSFGGVATTYALFNNPELQIDKYALLTTPDKFTERINDVARQVGIADKVKDQLIQKLEEEIAVDVQTLNVSDFVKTINVKKAFIIHDKNDRLIPIEQSRNVHRNWPQSSMEEIEGTGHFRILRTDSVLEKVIGFLE